MESIWRSLELESISRGFSYKEYVSWLRDKGIVGNLISEKFYNALQEAVEEEMIDTIGVFNDA